MSKEYKHIFEEDIIVPEIVQLKTEEALMQIKKKGINDTMKENNIIPMKQKSPKKSQILKICVTACACSALFISAGHFSNVQNVGGKNMGSNFVQNTENENGDIVQSLANMFTIQVYAADSSEASENGYVALEPGKSVISGRGLGYVFCKNKDGNVSYCIGTRFLCEGENIESITYEIENAAFQIVEPKDSSIITSFEEYGISLNTGSIGGEENEETGEILSVKKQYKAYTLDYENQSNDKTWINICNVTDSPWETVFATGNTLEDEVKSLEEMMKDVRITCTVHYSDGATDSSIITIGGTVIIPEVNGVPREDRSYAGFEFRCEE